MSTLPTRRTLTQECFLDLRDLIYERSGIFFPENKLYLLEGRLNKRLDELELESFEAYVSYLRRQSIQTEELKQVYNLITINETYFFRYMKQLEVFSQTLLPNMVKSREKDPIRRIRIWSAASSSGEELYTIAMMVKEQLNGQLQRWNLDLLGTDISNKILADARTAVYGRNSFRGSANAYYKSKYFAQEGTQLKMRDDIKQMVRFDYLNLNDLSAIRRQRGVDFLFCRNVLIYFDQDMKKKVLRSFYDILNHGGYLFLGEAESLHGISSAFKVEHFPGAFVYRKE